jgi:hypothetical protein
MFSARLINHEDTHMLNICDTELLGRTLNRDNFTLKISEKYYAEKTIEKEEAKELLKKSNNINMVGKEIISLSTSIGIGSLDGIKKIDGIPFLIVFKM